METGDFLNEWAKRAGARTKMTSKINGWSFATFMELAALTSYIKFGCDFNEIGLCKARSRNFDSAKAEKPSMCCCSGCRNCTGFIYDLPSNYDIITFYASHFDDKTGFWREGSGCVLPRSHRSPTCLTYNCDRNSCRPDSHKQLLACLKGKNGNMIIDGKKSTYYDLVANFRRWLEKPPTYKTASGSIDYAP
jgi:hypothetical protein